MRPGAAGPCQRRGIPGDPSAAPASPRADLSGAADEHLLIRRQSQRSPGGMGRAELGQQEAQTMMSWFVAGGAGMFLILAIGLGSIGSAVKAVG